MLAALPVGPKAAFPPWLGFFVLVMPYLAGALAGLMTVRIAPTPALEAAPLWGLVTGSLTAVVIGFGAKFSGGPLGAGRLASVGPAGGEVGLVAVLEVGVTAALVAGAANWLIMRHHIRRLAAAAAASQELAEHLPPVPAVPRRRRRRRPPAGPRHRPLPALVVDETDDAGGHRIHVNPWADEQDVTEVSRVSRCRGCAIRRSTEFSNCCWQAFCVAAVVAPFRQLAYCMYCDQKISSPASANAAERRRRPRRAPRWPRPRAAGGCPPASRARHGPETRAPARSAATASATATT